MKHKKPIQQYVLVNDKYAEYEYPWYIMSYRYHKYSKKTYYRDNEFSVRLSDIETTLSNDFHKVIHL